MLSDKAYEELVKESMRKYGTARKLSKIVNDLVEERGAPKSNIMGLIYSEKLTRTSAREFEQFRRSLSTRLEH